MENNFIKGLFVNKPSEKAPDFVIAKCSISADTFPQFLKENVNGKGYMNFDILRSNKDGKYYAKLDTFKPVEQTELKKDEIDISDCPF